MTYWYTMINIQLYFCLILCVRHSTLICCWTTVHVCLHLHPCFLSSVPLCRDEDGVQVFSLSDQRLVVLEVTVSNMPSDPLHPEEDGDDAHAAQLIISLPNTLSYSGARVPPQVWVQSPQRLEQVFEIGLWQWCRWQQVTILALVLFRWDVKRTRTAPKCNVNWETLSNEILRWGKPICENTVQTFRTKEDRMCHWAIK